MRKIYNESSKYFLINQFTKLKMWCVRAKSLKSITFASLIADMFQTKPPPFDSNVCISLFPFFSMTCSRSFLSLSFRVHAIYSRINKLSNECGVANDFILVFVSFAMLSIFGFNDVKSQFVFLTLFGFLTVQRNNERNGKKQKNNIYMNDNNCSDNLTKNVAEHSVNLRMVHMHSR